MKTSKRRARLLALSCLAMLLLGVQAQPQLQQPQAPLRPIDCMEAVAETRLLMDGLADPNVKGLERLLTQKPKSNEAWTFARGQALLLAETGNLLLLRPPRNNGEKIWARRAVELRESAVVLGRHLGQRDFAKSRASLIRVANVCNRCHHNFRVRERISPFQPARRQARSTD